MLTIYNSLTRRKETFRPLEAGKVRMYVCGMTVYDHLHIGHARMLLVFDMVVRYLRYRGFDVTFVRNITDVDDKIIQRANESGEEPAALAERFVEAMHEDTDALNMLRPDIEPRATGTMDEMIRMIETLIDKGYAYAVEGGDVYFDVSRFEGYGRLSGERPDEMRAGARVEVDEAKTDPLDFVLWKRAKEGEPSWDSPWGRGRPGWHIECSAMSTRELGNHFDIHGGGLDLKFPHHENEIAQSCAATGEPFANYWMHNGFVQVDDEKMSKSLGNFFTLRDILASYRPEEVRYFLLASHYRSPINFSDKNLDDARAALERLYLALRDLPDGEVPGDEPYSERFREAMDDDFNTPGAIAVLFDLVRELNRHRDADVGQAANLGALLEQLGGVLGLLQAEPDAFLKGDVTAVPGAERPDEGLSAEAIEALIEKRTQARRDRDFGEADRIRDYLLEQGIQLEDSPQGTRWRRG